MKWERVGWMFPLKTQHHGPYSKTWSQSLLYSVPSVKMAPCLTSRWCAGFIGQRCQKMALEDIVNTTPLGSHLGNSSSLLVSLSYLTLLSEFLEISGCRYSPVHFLELPTSSKSWKRIPKWEGGRLKVSKPLKSPTPTACAWGPLGSPAVSHSIV